SGDGTNAGSRAGTKWGAMGNAVDMSNFYGAAFRPRLSSSLQLRIAAGRFVTGSNVLRARKNLGFEDLQARFGVADGVRTERTLAGQRAEEFVGGPSMPFGHLRQEQSGVAAQPQDRAVA